VKYTLLLGLTFMILYPFIIRFSSTLMSAPDLADASVNLVPREPSLNNYRHVIRLIDFWRTMGNTALVCLTAASIQMLVCTTVGYGLARFRFVGRSIVFAVVIFTIIAPPQTFLISLFMGFRFFDVFGVIAFFGGSPLNLIDTLWPITVLSLIGFGFKNGLYIFMARQFFKGIPEELEEAAYADGAGMFRTYTRIILPLAAPIMVTIFLFAFSWQWTDTLYTNIFYSSFSTLPTAIFNLVVTADLRLAQNAMNAVYINTASLLTIAPLMLVFLFGQKWFVQGIARSGITG
jgi:multiple sugar transport system permease protein